MPDRLSVLTVTSTPHERPSSSVLRLILAELSRRPDIDSSLWFLREDPYGASSRGFASPDHPPFVVDSLRTWWPAALARGMGVEPIAAFLRGRRLRRLLRRVDPAVIILDDGLGERIFGAAEAHAVRIVRCNEDEPIAAGTEEPFRGEAAAWLCSPGVTGHDASGPVVRVSPFLSDLDYAVPRALGEPSEQQAMREELGLAPEELVVVGWGSGGWIDGPDLFLRGLWALRARHGVEATGLWIGDGVNDQDRDRLVAEAERCGLGERYHLVDRPEAFRLCGDVAFLPYRCRGEESVLDAVASGLPVVGFECLGIEEDAVTLVPDLDVDAAAAALARARSGDRGTRMASARSRLDVAGLVDDLLDLAEAARRS